MPTQLELSRRLKVSQITVSRALRGAPNVNAALRKRILDEAERLGYSFNDAARSLARGKTGRIGIVIPDSNAFDVHFFTAVLKGATSAAKNAGAGLIFINMSQMRSEAEVQRELRQADGFVVLNFRRIAALLPEIEKAMREAGKPFVLAQSHRTGDGPFLGVDNHAGAVKAMLHLHDLGHRRIAFYGATEPEVSSWERYEGYVKGLEMCGITAQEGWVSGVMEPDRGAFMATLHALPEASRPTAIFAWSDRAAVNCVHDAERLGMRVPDDFSVVGFGDITEVGTLFHPYLTTLHIPAAEVGAKAVDLLARGDLRREDCHVLFDPALVKRESAGPAAGL